MYSQKEASACLYSDVQYTDVNVGAASSGLVIDAVGIVCSISHAGINKSDILLYH